MERTCKYLCNFQKMNASDIYRLKKAFKIVMDLIII